MKKCLACGKETNNPKFCSRSCSASYNNIGVRRNGVGKKEKKCANCGAITLNPKFCSQNCSAEYRKKVNIKNFEDNGIVWRGLRDYLILKNNNTCSICGLDEWNSKPMPLEIEHKNGNSEDNSAENLSVICPNCHAQTDTYKGKNYGNGRYKRRERYKAGKSY